MMGKLFPSPYPNVCVTLALQLSHMLPLKEVTQMRAGVSCVLMMSPDLTAIISLQTRLQRNKVTSEEPLLLWDMTSKLLLLAAGPLMSE